MTSSFAYPNLLDAIKGVLLEASIALDQSGARYVVAGGWGPYLAPLHATLKHPGTADVDVLFHDEAGPILEAVKALLAVGYAPSAKHPFQLLKPLAVQRQDVIPGQQEFVFNIDLMHPRESHFQEGLFQDIMDLGVKSNYDEPHTAAVRSMVLPSARIVFDESLWHLVNVAGTLPNGTQTTHPVRVIDGAAVVLSKCESVSKPKRDRDAFDIYYVMTLGDSPHVIKKLKSLVRFPQVEKQIGKLRAFLRHPNNDFSKRVHKYANDVTIADPSRVVLSLLPEPRSCLDKILRRNWDE